ASEEIVARLGATLGPWPVSGPAIAIGTQALRDHGWRARTRASLAEAAPRLAALLSDCNLTVAGGTDLFKLVRTDDASALHEHLVRHGILVRAFAEYPDLLRFGLPAAEGESSRLRDALGRFGR
ncbi:MAG TPA: threonine-phosphate decarboxylase, partial [Methyloceanibacter sp.]|nr:threonine-phosphate decarboxylase [Methyloceanibacter sp.]